MVCFFLSLLKRKLPQGCPKQGGGGEGHFWTMSKRKQLFSQDHFPKSTTTFSPILQLYLFLIRQELNEIVKKNFDLRPGRIVKDLKLKNPIFQQTASYGRFCHRTIITVGFVVPYLLVVLITISVMCHGHPHNSHQLQVTLAVTSSPGSSPRPSNTRLSLPFLLLLPILPPFSPPSSFTTRLRIVLRPLLQCPTVFKLLNINFNPRWSDWKNLNFSDHFWKTELVDRPLYSTERHSLQGQSAFCPYGLQVITLLGTWPCFINLFTW